MFFRPVWRHITLLVVLQLLAGCTALRKEPPPRPFTFSVEEEDYDGYQLWTRLKLMPHFEPGKRDLAVRLRTFSEGEVHEELVVPLERLLEKDKRLKSDEEYEVTVGATGAHITNYQVEILWGAEAKAALRKNQLRMVSSTIEVVEAIPLADETRKSVAAIVRFVNGGSETCRHLQVKVRLYSNGAWGGWRTISRLPFVLKPGESRKVRLKFHGTLEASEQVIPELEVIACQ